MNQDVESALLVNQGTQLHSQTSRKLKRGRTVRGLIFVVYVFIATWMVTYAFVHKKEVKFLADRDLRNRIVKNQTCYRREEEETYPVFISLGLGLLGVLLAPFVRCLCEFVEQLFHLQRRDRRSVLRLFKSCFSVVPWKAVSVVFIIDFIFCVIVKKSFQIGDLMFIFGGIGVFPLVAYLLKLNEQSKVDLARSLQKKGLYPAYTIAWNYYLHYLTHAIPIFIECCTSIDTPEQDNTADSIPQLSLKKMILLFPYNGETKNLFKIDRGLTKITNISRDGYNFPVYRLTSYDRQYKCVIQYADEPLKTLKKMCFNEGVKCIHEGDLEEQVHLLYQTLENEVLRQNEECRNNCILVKIEKENMVNGWLAELIMHHIEEVELESKTEKTFKAFSSATVAVPQGETNNYLLSDNAKGPDQAFPRIKTSENSLIPLKIRPQAVVTPMF